MKLSLRFFLFVGLFLICGLVYGHAPKQQDDVYIHTTNILEWPRQEALSASKVIHISSIFSRSFKDKIEVSDSDDDDDDDELISFKKYAVSAYSHAGFSNFASAAVLGSYLKKCLLFHKHFSYISAHRYILFRVIRI